jgi:DmsE family decaheme c-type cytochrome
MLKFIKHFSCCGTSTLILSYAFMFVFFFSVFVSGETPPDAVEVGDEACLMCHDELGQDFESNIHYRLVVGDNHTCEACHGPGSKHAEDGDAALIYNPQSDYIATGKNMCTGCHNGIEYNSWQGLAHSEVSEGCSDCHTIHGEEKHLLTKQEPALCFDCHSRQKSQARMPSHHPVLEGLVACSDCHAIHSEEVNYTVGEGKRELCLSCHTSLQGPFIFEHEPVNEDCSICHDPHGTIADNLLIQNEPFLCLSCHSMHFHVTLVGYEGEFSAPQHPERGGISTKDGMKKAMLTKCTQCHSEIHGSDLPSQSISGSGKALTR